jgi:N utilization substance protein B
MGNRRKARECVLQVLFQLEFDDSTPDKAFNRYIEERDISGTAKEYSRQLFKGIISSLDKIDSTIQSVSEHWRLSRMAVVDRNILRIAVFELLNEKSLAPAIPINEAIEIGKKYGTDQSATFINGVLDALRKKMEEEKTND